jgi:hypothetical protein
MEILCYSEKQIHNQVFRLVPALNFQSIWSVVCACTQFSIHLIGYVICAEFGACRLKHLVALGHRLYCARFRVHFQGAAQVLSRGGIWIIISSVSFMSDCLSGRVVSASLSYLFPLFLFCSSISSACSYQSLQYLLCSPASGDSIQFSGHVSGTDDL